MLPGTRAAQNPEQAAVVMARSGQTLSFGALEAGSARLARLLQRRGLRPGDGVAMLSGNDPAVFTAYWSTQRSGLYLTAVNHHLAPDEIAYIVRDSGASALIVSADVADLARRVGELVPSVTIRFAFAGAVGGFDPLDQALSGLSAEPLDEEPRGSVMLYSSGTTGRPKGIRRTLPDRRVDEPGDPYTEVFGQKYDFGPATVYLSPAPLYHAGPLQISASVQTLGGTVVVMEHFDAEAALAAIERYHVTHSQWVPTMFVRMLKLPPQVRGRYDCSSMRYAVHAAAPCPPEVKRAMIDWWGPVIHEFYGATEGVGNTFIDTAEWLRRPGSVGRPVGVTVRICADDGTVLPPGRVGTVYFARTEATFVYHNDPERTAASRHPLHPGWTTTGDLGYLDDDGYLYLTDRRAFTIISGGVNIYPREIEDVLTLHPAVLDVAVIGVPDDEMGESVLAVVEPVPGATPGPELASELIEYVRSRIAHFKAPRRVEFGDMPRTPTGKLVKQSLRDRYSPTRSQ